MHRNTNKPIILMIEQDEDDTILTRSVFEERKYEAEIHFLTQAGEAMQWLDFSASKAILPSVILININIVPTGGIDLCKKLKTGPYKSIPVVVLGDSSHPHLVKQSYDAGANSYIQKPSLSDPTYLFIDNFMKYWFQTVTLPNF